MRSAPSDTEPSAGMTTADDAPQPSRQRKGRPKSLWRRPPWGAAIRSLTNRLSRAMGCWASGAEQKCTTGEVIRQRNCPRQLFGTSVTEAGWQQAGRVSEDGFWRDLWVV